MFPPEDSNVLIPAGKVEDRFKALKRNRVGVYASIVDDQVKIPRPFFSLDRHVQGVAIPDSRAVLTRNMHIFGGKKANNQNDTFKCEFDLNDELKGVTDNDDRAFDHLGGIQTIGKWFVVGFENNRNSQIRFYKFDDNGKPEFKNHLTINRDKSAGSNIAVGGKKNPHKKAGKAGSVGITNYKDDEGDRYLLAVCPWENEIHFYRSQPKVRLSDCRCSFGVQPFRIWRKSGQEKKDGWRPDDKWGGYPNAISLLADDAGVLYLVGMHWSWFRDIADLYRVDLGEAKPKLTKLAKFSADCRDGTHFLYGGSAFVTESRHIRLFACERNVQDYSNGTRYVRMNIFHHKKDAQ